MGRTPSLLTGACLCESNIGRQEYRDYKTTLSSIFTISQIIMKINLGSIQIPINGATKTFAILAKRGAGKSYTGAVMAEELHKNNVPFVVFDPIDVWWGLRLAKNGKDK